MPQQPDQVHLVVDLRIREWLERQEAEAESGSLLPPHAEGGPSGEDHAQFLVCNLYGPYLRIKPELQIEIRLIWPKERMAELSKGSDPVTSRIFPFSEFSSYYRRAIKANGQGYGVYLGINPRPASKKKKEADIRDVVCLWVDIDAKNFVDGKPGAWKRISEFPIEPTIIVDSGRGYHPYWILKEPIIDRTDEDTAALKQTMVGLARVLGGDVGVRDIDRVFRLPGTLHTKDGNNLIPSRIAKASPEFLYSLGDFDEYRDHRFEESPPMGAADGVELQGITETISYKDAQSAAGDVAKLKVSPKTRRLIITGDISAPPGKDRTRSGRDFRIICGLVAVGYSYATARAIFFNRYLPCSDRILEDNARGEQTLRYDFMRAVEYIRKKRAAETPQIKAVRDIKAIPEMSAEAKLRQIRDYVVSDLFDNIGAGYKNAASKRKFFFDTGKKMLLDIAGSDFSCFLRDRYDLPEKDMIEVQAGVETRIWATGLEIEPFNFARYDDETGVLHVSNHDNTVFRLDGESIQVVDNGTDGIIFEYHPDYTTIDIKPPFPTTCNYFTGGFDWSICQHKSLLAKHLIEKTSFATEATRNLQPAEQRYLLALYFYSLFFESILEEKPIICWTGVKASGKTFISAAIGKILLGPAFRETQLSEDLRDLHTAMIENYYVILDNVDGCVRTAIMDALCRVATGATITKRKLNTDNDELKIRPRVFLNLTSRDPHFKRDDLVDRLIIFNTTRVVNPKGRSSLLKSMINARPAIWAEILTNLNSVVDLLREKRDWNPPGIFRIADWELWAKKVSNEKGQAHLEQILLKMNKEKAHFGLEDDPFYILLSQLCFDQDEKIVGLTAGQLHAKLSALDDKDYNFRYKSSLSLAKRLNNNIEELRNEFDIEILPIHGKGAGYHISSKKEGK